MNALSENGSVVICVSDRKTSDLSKISRPSKTSNSSTTPEKSKTSLSNLLLSILGFVVLYVIALYFVIIYFFVNTQALIYGKLIILLSLIFYTSFYWCTIK